MRRHYQSAKALASRHWEKAAQQAFPEREKERNLEEEFTALSANVEKLHSRIFELEDRLRSNVVAKSSAATLNLTSRSLALKLSRSGRDPREIASILGVPQGEVTLLLKVQRFQALPVRAEKESAKECKEDSRSIRKVSNRREKNRAMESIPASVTPAIQ